MSNQTQQGYFVIGDISGFTSYVARTELEHSQEILTELLELIHHHTRHFLRLVKFEGDAIFCYAPIAEATQGERLMDMVEATYVAFRNRVAGIQKRTTCQCNACRALPSLDLKFFAHFGSYMNQTIAGISDLVGSDVNLLHRLTKNTITETTGWNAYVLFTAAVLDQMGIEPGDMHASVETYEHLGDVQTYSLDLRKRYKEISETRRMSIKAEDADVEVSATIDAPPAVVWEWLTDPVKRNIVAPPNNVWAGAVRPGGRTGVGATNHCAHGNGRISIENILDWRPYVTYAGETITMGNHAHLLNHTFIAVLEPVGEEPKTHYRSYWKLARPSIVGYVFVKVIWPVWYKRILRKMEAEILADANAHAGNQPAVS